MATLCQKLFAAKNKLPLYSNAQSCIKIFKHHYSQDGNSLGYIQDISDVSMSEFTSNDDRISLGRNRFVTINLFMNRPLVDIREYFEKDGVLRPGLKGLSLRPAEWKKLKENVDLIDERLENLIKQKGGLT